MSEFATATTVLTGLAVGVANVYLSGQSGAFAVGAGQHPQVSRQQSGPQSRVVQAAGPREALGAKSLLGFGAVYGVAASALRVAGRMQRRRTARKAAEIDVAEKTEAKVVPYFESLPRSIVDKATLDKLLSTLPKEQWEDPPEDSYLYVLKCYAETYGDGKATKMGWWDYWYLKVNALEAGDFSSGEALEEDLKYQMTVLREGRWPEMKTAWRGPEPFAGDQVATPLTARTVFVDSLAFYREGLQTWQRGLQIGLAHGYFLVGPFTALGPLRNTPEAATVGLLCACAIVGIVSVGGLLFGATVKPTRFDKPGDAPAAGFQEMINWHAVGGLGGAGVAHALLTIF